MSRYCTKCGRELREDAIYCPGCGWKAEPRPYGGEPEKRPRPKIEKPTVSPEERRRNGLVILAVILLATAAILVVSMLLSGWMARNDPCLGRYDSLGSKLNGLTLEPEGEWLELSRKGKVTICIEDTEFRGKWTLDGEKFQMKQGGDSYGGTLTNGMLTLTVNDRTYLFLQTSDEVPTEAPEAPEETGSTMPTQAVWAVSDYSWWDRDFYGWWISKDSEESWHSGKEFVFWDLCASVDVDGDRGTVKLWDTDCAAGELLGEVKVAFAPGTTYRGCLTSLEGNFDLGQLEKGDWTVDPGEGYMGLSQMVCIEGSYEIYGVTRDYMIFLRPWGMSWEDVREAPPHQLFFRDMMPAHYDDWYWPKAREGEEMPPYFVGLVFPQIHQ